MDIVKCTECGSEVAAGVKECPSCGCPIPEKTTETISNTVSSSTEKKKKINYMSIISLVLGAIIIIMGISVMNKEIDIESHNASNYDVDYAAFGGDFYTEIYGASDVIVDELDEINNGIELLSESIETVANVVYYPIGMLMVSLGIGVIAISCNYIKKEE